jgi:ABC-type Mn2+/Zn2+ transport system permease subunit
MRNSAALAVALLITFAGCGRIARQFEIGRDAAAAVMSASHTPLSAVHVSFMRRHAALGMSATLIDHTYSITPEDLKSAAAASR